MLWEELTAPAFVEAVAAAGGTCLVPIGVIEKHGDHLPLGTDLLNVRALAARAAELEPAVVFPPYYFGQICEARHQPGTLAFDDRFLLDGLARICAEIARNGLKKIVLVNGHGGNNHLLPFFVQTTLGAARDYSVYLIGLEAACPPAARELLEEKEGGHADELETSVMLAIRPDLVAMDAIDREAGRPRGRLAHLAGVYTAIWWYADHPDHQAGDPSLATADKGRRLLEIGAANLARLIGMIKEDHVVAEFQNEFYRSAERPMD